MQIAVAELLHDWHDFYLLAGTASATLVGLMFVAASIAISVFDQSRQSGFQAFISPTVVHFTSALYICVLATIPAHSWLPLAGLLAAGGAAGLIYTARIVARVVVRREFKVDVVDRIFYAGLPAAGYLLIVVAGVMLMLDKPIAADLLAAALLALLLTAIRNAWDMMMWIVLRTPASVPLPTGEGTEGGG